MITIEKTLDIAPSYDFSLIAPRERILFFDIETTGLSAARSGLYLIGAVYWQEGAWRLRQWFADSLFDEEEMLEAFFGLLGEKKKLARAGGGRGSAVLIHFNGDTFDIPYIQRLARQYRLPWDLSGVLSIDLYKKIRPYRELLGLQNCKLKTVEQYFGISREDPYSGGELIYVYEEYLRLRNLEEGSCENNPQNRALRERLLQTLLLHNEEDMTNLPLLCGLLSYDELFRRQFSLTGAELVELPSAGGGKVLDLRFRMPGGLPRELDLSFGPYVFCGEEDRELNLAVSLYEGELKYFFPDYKNYYYLPIEDYAVHRSVGEFVEKGARKPATARTCYQKKAGLFLPEPEAIFAPVFYEEYKGSRLYAAYSPELLKREEQLTDYAGAVLSLFLKNARKRNK